MTLDVTTSLAALLAGDLHLLRWPEQGDLREVLRLAGTPCLLVVGQDQPPPEEWDELEDWIREPFDILEFEARKSTLLARVRRVERRPRIDESGLLWVGHSWAAIPTRQLSIAQMLVDRLDSVVRRDELIALCDEAGSSDHAAALQAAVGRLERRFASVGLRLRSVRGRGYLLELDDSGSSDTRKIRAAN